jgi:hypothetical protein
MNRHPYARRSTTRDAYADWLRDMDMDTVGNECREPLPADLPIPVKHPPIPDDDPESYK